MIDKGALVHAAIAAAVVAATGVVLGLWPMVGVLAVSTVFWPIREYRQHGGNLTPHQFREAIWPMIAGAVAAVPFLLWRIL